MEVIRTGLDGVLILEPKVFEDSRGYFFESYIKCELDEAIGHEINFVQDNQSCSRRGVIRGLHFQKPPYTQAKLVRCVYGRVLDIALDLRHDSATFGQHISIELTGDNRRALFIPHGFAHGFAVLSDIAVFQYKCDNYYNRDSEGGISVVDPTLGIDWHIDPNEAILSEKDVRLPLLTDFNNCF